MYLLATGLFLKNYSNILHKFSFRLFLYSMHIYHLPSGRYNRVDCTMNKSLSSKREAMTRKYLAVITRLIIP